MTPEQQAASDEAQKKIAAWRAAATPDTWKAVRRKWDDAGIDLALLCYNMRDSMKDEDIAYGFNMAKGLGVKGMTASTTLTMAKRIAPIGASTSCWWADTGTIGLATPTRRRRWKATIR